jgi:hypothetical protein
MTSAYSTALPISTELFEPNAQLGRSKITSSRLYAPSQTIFLSDYGMSCYHKLNYVSTISYLILQIRAYQPMQAYMVEHSILRLTQSHPLGQK